MSLVPGAALVAGTGPGVSGHLARLLAAEGRDLALLGADADVLATLADELGATGVRVVTAEVDLTDDAATRTAVEQTASEVGPLALVHVNPSAWRGADPLELAPADLLLDVALGVGALLSVVQAAHPHLADGARVSVTGSMAADEPSYDAASLGVQKAGVRNLVRSLDARLATEGRRAVSVTVRGALADEGPFSHAAVARAVRAAVDQPGDDWHDEVPYEGGA
ncbi:SDR family oxidoreductase [Nocardioides marmoraquaticus]